MHIHARIQKWGNGLGLRVSGVMRDLPNFRVGTEVDVDVTEHGFNIRKIEPKRLLMSRYTEAQLLADLDEESIDQALLAQPLAGEIEHHE